MHEDKADINNETPVKSFLNIFGIFNLWCDDFILRLLGDGLRIFVNKLKIHLSVTVVYFQENRKKKLKWKRGNIFTKIGSK